MGEMGVNYSRLLIIGRAYYPGVNLEVGRDDNFLWIFLHYGSFEVLSWHIVLWKKCDLEKMYELTSQYIQYHLFSKYL